MADPIELEFVVGEEAGTRRPPPQHGLESHCDLVQYQYQCSEYNRPYDCGCHSTMMIDGQTATWSWVTTIRFLVDESAHRLAELASCRAPETNRKPQDEGGVA
ncbi:hypothetical protein VP1G_11438 [Cytospora mali]|uniref:Uncharacterized protein n=1 Tax=Cytospora mali TaxID=578113 RepID=A0A194VEU3_CYTMA|nr:hypothetical protein VP1G_11438 [Valsa mali var. pyri (nom. inval.)]